VPCPCGKSSCLPRVFSPTKMQLNQAYAIPTTGAGRYKQFGIDSGSPILQIPEADAGTYPMRPSQKKAMGDGREGGKGMRGEQAVWMVGCRHFSGPETTILICARFCVERRRRAVVVPILWFKSWLPWSQGPLDRCLRKGLHLARSQADSGAEPHFPASRPRTRTSWRA